MVLPVIRVNTFQICIAEARSRKSINLRPEKSSRQLNNPTRLYDDNRLYSSVMKEEV